MTLATLMLTSLSLLACKGEPEDGPTDSGVEEIDQDGDGFLAEEDCDDDDASVYPGASEACDGLDNNCDGEIDEEAPSWYADADLDGFGAGAPVQQCEAPQGFVSNGEDCDDDDDRVNPEAVEICDDVDQDCDGEPYAPQTASVYDGFSYVDIGEELSGDLVGSTGTDFALVLCEGTWKTGLTVEHDVRVVGLGDVVLDGGGTRSLFEVKGGSLELYEVSLENGFGAGSQSGAMVAASGGEVYLQNVNIQGALGDESTSAVIFVQEADFSMAGGRIVDSTMGGGAIKMWHNASVALDGVTIENVTSTQSGILNMWGGDSSPMSMANTILDGNTSADSFGAISNYGGGVFTCTDGVGFGGGVRNHNNAALSFEFDAAGTGAEWSGCDMENVSSSLYFKADGFSTSQWADVDQSFSCAYDSNSGLVNCE